MSNKKKTDNEEGVLRFIRLKNGYEDLVGYVTNNGDGYVKIFCPLRVEIETLFEEGRQILSLQEYLPQSIIEIKEIKIPTTDIMFFAPVKYEFYEQYEHVCDFFYKNSNKLSQQPKRPTTKNKEPIEQTEVEEQTQKVVSILEALASKKDKPIH